MVVERFVSKENVLFLRSESQAPMSHKKVRNYVLDVCNSFCKANKEIKSRILSGK